MKILLIDIDSTIPNLALKKIEKFYEGNEIIWNNPLSKFSADKIYVSCIFPENKPLCKEWEGCAEIGGTGYDLYKKLPPEIDAIKPKINWGFTTRGCIRKCLFCFVPQKEGYISIEGDIYDIWDGKSKEVVVMDNNILALPEHFKNIAMQLTKEKLTVDFNQGLDHRLLTPEICRILLGLRHKHEIRFAFDDIAYKKTVISALGMLKYAGMKDWKSRWYVYVSPQDTFETVMARLLLLKENKQGAYLMRDKKVKDNKMYMALAQWVNTIGAFKMGTIEEVFNKSKKLQRYKKYIPILNQIDKE